MDTFLRGFVHELVKVAGDAYGDVLQDARKEVRKDNRDDRLSIRRGGGPVKRDYVASTLIGATSMPLMAIASKAIGRKMHNRDVRRAMRGASPSKARELAKELQQGPLIGRGRPDLPASQRPSLTHGELLASAAAGGMSGSVLQALRDRLSGSAKA